MRTWHVEFIQDHKSGFQWVVLRDNGQAYAYCISQARAANVCQALNYQEQSLMQIALEPATRTLETT